MEYSKYPSGRISEVDMMRKRTSIKLRSQAGETIAEVLVALLISSVALIMLASMISATSSMVTRSKTAMEAYYEANESLERRTDSTKTADINITIQDAGGAYVVIKAVSCFENQALGKSIYAYGNP